MKHKGNSIPKDWTELYHKANPLFRDKIEIEGLKIMKGDSYMCYSPEDTEPPAIFAYWGDVDYYDTTFDDDIWVIDVTKLDNEFFIDNGVSGTFKHAVVTYANIPRNALTLIYKGSGNSSF